MRSMHTPSVQVNSSELQELKRRFLNLDFSSKWLPGDKTMWPNLREREMVWSWVLHAKSPLTRHTCFPVSDHILWPWWIKLVPWLLDQTKIWPWAKPTNHHRWDVRIGDRWYSWVVCNRDVPLVETLVVLDLRIFLSCAWGWCFQQNNHQSHLCRIWDRSPHHCSPWSQCQSQIYEKRLRKGKVEPFKTFHKDLSVRTQLTCPHYWGWCRHCMEPWKMSAESFFHFRNS